MPLWHFVVAGFFKAMYKLYIFLAFIFCFSTSLLAADWNDLWLTRDQQAKKAMDIGNYDAATELFEDLSKPSTPLYAPGQFVCAQSS